MAKNAFTPLFMWCVTHGPVISLRASNVLLESLRCYKYTLQIH